MLLTGQRLEQLDRQVYTHVENTADYRYARRGSTGVGVGKARHGAPF